MVRRHGMQIAAVAGLGLLWAAAGQGQGLKLNRVDVLPAGDAARVVLDVDGAVQAKSFVLHNPERLVVDLAGVTNAVKNGSQSFATGPVSRVRVSQFKREPEAVVRVVADLRAKVPFKVESQDEDVVVVVGTPPATAAEPAESAARATGDAPPVDASIAGASSAAQAPATDPGANTAPTYVPFTPVGEAAATGAPPANGASSAAHSDGSDANVAPPPANGAPASTPNGASAEDAAAHPQTAAETATGPADFAAEPEPMQVAAERPHRQALPRRVAHVALDEDTSPDAPPGGVELRPTGTDKRINIDVQGADIHTVLRTLAEYSGKNIIASKDVEGTVSARLYDTPWSDALSSILKAHGYGMVEENGIIRVGVLQKIRSEELDEAAADRKREDLQPIETQVVRLQFSDAGELKPALQDMLSARGKLQVDARTNSLIISDIPAYVGKIATMAQDLDSRTPQVEIVTKLVDVSADDSQDLGITWNAVNVMPPGSNVVGHANVTAGVTNPAATLRLGTVQSFGQLDATLEALEKKKKANVVSNPNITTVNNREAKILVGSKIPLIVADQAGNAITQLTKIGIQMSCTPHINSDKTITLDLHTEVSELSSQATVQGGVIIQTSEADTRVLVETGDTAIIGGLLRNVVSSTKQGVPLLQDMPLVGWLFRSSNLVDSKRELIIFVTPTLIEAGQKPQGLQPPGKG